METTAYESEILRQLADTKTYVQLHNNPVLHIQDRIKKVITYAKKKQDIDNDTKKYLIPEHPVTRIIYQLPKIHKDPLNLPGCHIVSITTSIAKFLDRCLTPLI